MPTMPNVVGLELAAAEASLTTAGVLNTSTLGYFGTWPITAVWQSGAVAPTVVITQSPANGASVAVNASVTLHVAVPKISVAYP